MAGIVEAGSGSVMVTFWLAPVWGVGAPSRRAWCPRSYIHMALGPKRLGVVTSGWSVQLTATYAACGAHIHSCMVHAPWTVVCLKGTVLTYHYCRKNDREVLILKDIFFFYYI